MVRIQKKYKRIDRNGLCEFSVQKSRFISFGTPVVDEKEVRDYIEKIKRTYPDANHNVYAYILGKNLEIQKFTDDGEPSGTAGKPILELMKKEELVNSLIVVTRYFGGIKLGAGGLIRAYSKSAKNVVEHNGIATMRLYQLLDLEFDYHYWGKIENELRNREIFKMKSIEYHQYVHCQVYVPPERTNQAKNIFMDLTAGQGEMMIMSEEYLKEE